MRHGARLSWREQYEEAGRLRATVGLQRDGTGTAGTTHDRYLQLGFYTPRVEVTDDDGDVAVDTLACPRRERSSVSLPAEPESGLHVAD